MAKHKWLPGDTRRFITGRSTVEVYAGLFWYHGFGMGEFFSRSGKVRFCNRTEAVKHAHKEKVEFKFIDCFQGYVGTYLGD